MRCKAFERVSPFWRITAGAVIWLLLISGLHFYLNMDRGTRRVVRMGYMPVITNLASPLLDFASRESGEIRFQAIKFASFAEMAEALRNDQIQAAFMIAPLSIVLRQQGEDIRVVCIGNRHESTLVVRKDLGAKTFDDLAGRTLAVPMRFSGHNLSVLRLLEEAGLTGQVKVVEMNPPDMPAALTTGALDAYFVGEPFAAQTLKDGNATLLFYVEDVWKNFICNLVVVKQSFIDAHPGIVQQLVQGAARAGVWAHGNPDEAATIASEFWNQPKDLVRYAMTTPENRIVYDRYIPKLEELQYMADLMVRFRLIESPDITGLMEDRFALAADLSDGVDIATILPSDGSKAAVMSSEPAAGQTG